MRGPKEMDEREPDASSGQGPVRFPFGPSGLRQDGRGLVGGIERA